MDIAEDRKFEIFKYASELGFWEWNLKTNQVIYDSRWCEILGYDLDEVDQCLETWEKLMHPEDLGPAREAFADYLSGFANEYEVRFRMKHKNSSWIPILSKGKILKRSNDGKPEIFSGTHFDMTKIQDIEDQLIKTKLLQQNKSRFATVGELAASVGHEVNNPLSIIRFLADSLHSNEKISVSDFNKLDDNLNRIHKVIKSLMTLSKFGNFEKQNVDLNELVESTVDLLSSSDAYEGRIILNKCNMPLWVNIDATRIQEALLNLIKNAKDASGGDSKIIIKTSYDEKNILIDVMDRGRGVCPSVVPNIFNVFFTTKESGAGLGMGLPIAKETLQEHGGDVLYKRDGDNTIFSLKIPHFKNIEEITLNRQKTNPVKNFRVLVVDDEQAIVEAITDSLEFAGIHSEAAFDGEQALKALSKQKYDFIITDVNMPRMNGFEFVKRAVEDLNFDKNNIIVITGGYCSSTVGDSESDIKKYCKKILMKPFSLIQLSEEVVSSMKEKYSFNEVISWK